MSARVWQRPAIMALVITTLAACRTGPRPEPGDPMLDAIRADERQGGLSYSEGQGKHLFVHYCATCHGDEGRGDGQNASNLNPPPPDLTASKDAADPVLLRKVITDGSAATGRSPLSPPLGRSLSPQEIDYLVGYCQSLSRKKPS